MLNGLKFVLLHPNNKGRLLNTIFTLLWWKFNQLFIKIPCIVKINNEIRFVCYPESSFGSLIVYTILPEYLEMKWMQKWLKKGDIFIDIGANIGLFTVLGANKVTKSGKTIVFEPDDRPRKMLRENLALNKLEFVEVEDMVVDTKSGKISFYKSNESELSRISVTSAEKESPSSVLLKSISLDDYTERINIKNIDLLKIDVEGSEVKVLNGAKKLLKRKAIRAILFEHNQNNFIKETIASEYLKEMDYEIYILNRNHKLNKLLGFPNGITNLIALPK